jgi:membrane-associated protease RseP (regulator of RpoE activity)
MLGPYRTVAAVTVDTSCPTAASVRAGRCAGCDPFVPEPPRFYARIHAASSTPRCWGRLRRIASGAAVVLALGATAAAAGGTILVIERLLARHLPARQLPPVSVAIPRQIQASHLAPVVINHLPHPPAEPPAPGPSPLALTGPESHDPVELHRRAERLAKAGIDVAFEHHKLKERAFSAFPSRVRAFPDKVGDRTVGVRFYGVKEDSEMAAIGFRNGDRLTAINGHPVIHPDRALSAANEAQTSRAAVFEITRAGRPVILSLDWR